MSDEATGWQYDAVPPRSWTWSVELDATLQCPADKDVQLTPNGLAYTGNCFNPNWGGGYTIGFQTCDEFLARGSLEADMPPALAAEIRAYLEAHRRSGPPTTLALVVAIDDDDPRTLERVDCALDGATLSTRAPASAAATRGEHEFFRGAVAPGRHVVRVACVMNGEAPRIAYANDVTIELEVGASRRVCFRVERGTNRAVLVQ